MYENEMVNEQNMSGNIKHYDCCKHNEQPGMLKLVDVR